MRVSLSPKFIAWVFWRVRTEPVLFVLKVPDSLGRLRIQENPATSASIGHECYSFPTCIEANIPRTPPGADMVCAAAAGYNGAIHRNAAGQGTFVSPAPCHQAVGHILWAVCLVVADGFQPSGTVPICQLKGEVELSQRGAVGRAVKGY